MELLFTCLVPRVDIVDIEDVKTELLDALTRGEITQKQVDEKLAWVEAKVRG